jgi:hypothetical protein
MRSCEIIPRNGSFYVIVDGIEWSRHNDLQVAEAVRAQLINTGIEVVDEVQLEFDWHPVMENGRIVFQSRVTRVGRTSTVNFEIDLTKLREAELQLADFLSRQHAGLVSGYELSRILCWLLDISIAQTQPGLSKALRDSKVRELLLSKKGGQEEIGSK